jgi:glucuronate isomerase
VKKLNLFVEVQGRQHTEFVKHFHTDKKAFLQQKERDNLKRLWVEENDFYLIRINYDEDITEELILSKIKNAMDSEDGFWE